MPSTRNCQRPALRRRQPTLAGARGRAPRRSPPRSRAARPRRRRARRQHRQRALPGPLRPWRCRDGSDRPRRRGHSGSAAATGSVQVERQQQHRVGAVVAPFEAVPDRSRAGSPRSPAARSAYASMRGQAARTSPQVSLPSASLSRSSATSRSRSAMSQRTSSRPGAAAICRYESLDLCAWASAGARARARARPAARTPARHARRRHAQSKASMRRSCRPSDGLQAPRFVDRVAPAARARRLREHAAGRAARAAARRRRAPARSARAGVALDERGRTSPARGRGRCCASGRSLASAMRSRISATSRAADAAVARLPAIARRSTTASVRVSPFSTASASPAGALRDQEVGIGDRRIACRGRA